MALRAGTLSAVIAPSPEDCGLRVAAAGFFALLLALLGFLAAPSTTSALRCNHGAHELTVAPSAPAPRVLSVRYVPSAYELEWALHRAGEPDNSPVCDVQASAEHKPRVEAVLRAIDAQHMEGYQTEATGGQT